MAARRRITLPDGRCFRPKAGCVDRQDRGAFLAAFKRLELLAREAMPDAGKIAVTDLSRDTTQHIDEWRIPNSAIW